MSTTHELIPAFANQQNLSTAESRNLLDEQRFREYQRAINTVKNPKNQVKPHVLDQAGHRLSRSIRGLNSENHPLIERMIFSATSKDTSEAAGRWFAIVSSKVKGDSNLNTLGKCALSNIAMREDIRDQGPGKAFNIFINGFAHELSDMSQQEAEIAYTAMQYFLRFNEHYFASHEEGISSDSVLFGQARVKLEEVLDTVETPVQSYNLRLGIDSLIEAQAQATYPTTPSDTPLSEFDVNGLLPNVNPLSFAK